MPSSSVAVRGLALAVLAVVGAPETYERNLIDRGVKSRIAVGGFSGDGDPVEILVPST